MLRSARPTAACTHEGTPARQERGTSDGGRPLAVRRAHRAEGECAIAGSEERAGNKVIGNQTWPMDVEELNPRGTLLP